MKPKRERATWPAYVEAIRRAGALDKFIRRNGEGLESWPPEGLTGLRKMLFPLVSRLWPERFKDSESNGKVIGD
jgi:hypothetical protein